MSILSYIIPNVIIALILAVGVLQGQKRGWKKSLIKLGYTLVLAVGSFFLSTYVIVPALATLGEFGGYMLFFPTAIWMVLFVLLMFIAELIFVLVCHKTDKVARANRKERKLAKSKDETKKTKEAKLVEKQHRKDEKKALRVRKKEEAKAWRATHKKSRIFGAIIGFVGSLVCSIMLMLFVRNTAYGVAIVSGDPKVAEVCETVHSFYDHSVVGLIDNAIAKEDGTCEEKIYEYQVSVSMAKLLDSAVEDGE